MAQLFVLEWAGSYQQVEGQGAGEQAKAEGYGGRCEQRLSLVVFVADACPQESAEEAHRLVFH